MRVFASLFLLVMVLLAWSGCSPKAGSSQDIVIRVGGQSITAGDIERIVGMMSFESGIPKQEVWASIEGLVDRIVDDALILEYGKGKGIALTGVELERAIGDIVKDYPEGSFQEMLINRCIEYDEWRERVRKHLLIRKIVEEHTRSLPPVSHHAMKTYYEEKKEDFWHPPRVELMQIVCKTRDEAEAELARLEGGEDMATIVREQSRCSGLHGGPVSSWATSDMLPPSLADVVFSIPVGEVSGIIETPYGCHIVKVLKREPEGRKELVEVMDEIEDALLSEAMERHYTAWIEQLRKDYPVEVDHALLDKMRKGHEGT
jgi:parvulin-like peptidyl-prolyl isomerase